MLLEKDINELEQDASSNEEEIIEDENLDEETEQDSSTSDFSYEAPRDRLIREKEIKEQLLKNPVIKAEYMKSYYRTAEITYCAKVKEPIFNNTKIKIIVFQAVIWALLIAETIMASVGPKYFSWGTIFDIVYIFTSSFILASVIKTKYHSKGEYLLNKTVFKADQNKYDLVEVSSKFKITYWINLLLLVAGTIVDITNIGINVHVVFLPLVFIQVALVAILFIVYTCLTYSMKDLYGMFKMVIAHGEIRQTLPDKDTVYDFDTDYVYSTKAYFVLNKDLKDYNIGI